MSKVSYTAGAHVTGGRTEGHSRTSDGAWRLSRFLPRRWVVKKSRRDQPEQPFGVGFTACFEDALGVAACRPGRKPVTSRSTPE
jgi:organic hydroperoxide reductase OsmC/OhrA